MGMRTRYEERKRKRRQNFILNVLIGIVLICIVAVGIQIISDPSSQTESNRSQSSENAEQSAEKNESKNNDADEENDDEDSEFSANSESSDGYTFIDGGPSGPWHPIGTKQTGEHVTTFEKGSLDWEEMEMALAYGAGIDRNNMTVLWIGNGGDPQKAKGKVKSKDDPNTIYHVLIEWVDEKGWKPIEVTIEQ